MEVLGAVRPGAGDAAGEGLRTQDAVLAEVVILRFRGDDAFGFAHDFDVGLRVVAGEERFVGRALGLAAHLLLVGVVRVLHEDGPFAVRIALHHARRPKLRIAVLAERAGEILLDFALQVRAVQLVVGRRVHGALLKPIDQRLPALDGILRVVELLFVHDAGLVVRLGNLRLAGIARRLAAGQRREHLFFAGQPTGLHRSGFTGIRSRSRVLGGLFREDDLELVRAAPVVLQRPIAPVVLEVAAAAHAQLGVVGPKHPRARIPRRVRLRRDGRLQRLAPRFRLGL